MTRDIAYAVSYLAWFMLNPGCIHWEVVKRVIRYLKGTKDEKLILGRGKCSLERKQGKPINLESKDTVMQMETHRSINMRSLDMLSAWTEEQSHGIKGKKLSSHYPQLNLNMLLWCMLQRRWFGSECFWGTFYALWRNWWCYIATTNPPLLLQKMISTMLAWNTLTFDTTSFGNQLTGR